MNDVTLILSRIESGDPTAAEELLPLVYDELRKLAAARLAFEKPGQTLQATALVHEVFLRLMRPVSQGSGVGGQESDVGGQKSEVGRFDGRGHFFAAAAEAMRRILVENARRKKRLRHGGDRQREELNEASLALPEVHEDLIALDAALLRLAAVDPQAVKLVQLRYFAGLSVSQAAELLCISPRTADRVWAFARAWLHREISGQELSGAGESQAN
jgi:RNA polymerase sigma factor (sigma-70 family)